MQTRREGRISMDMVPILALLIAAPAVHSQSPPDLLWSSTLDITLASSSSAMAILEDQSTIIGFRASVGSDVQRGTLWRVDDDGDSIEALVSDRMSSFHALCFMENGFAASGIRISPMNDVCEVARYDLGMDTLWTWTLDGRWPCRFDQMSLSTDGQTLGAAYIDPDGVRLYGFSLDGDLLWEGNTTLDFPGIIYQLVPLEPDGWLIVSTEEFHYSTAYQSIATVIRMGAEGQLLWYWRSEGDWSTYACSGIQTENGFLIAGFMHENYGGTGDPPMRRVVELDPDGNYLGETTWYDGDETLYHRMRYGHEGELLLDIRSDDVRLLDPFGELIWTMVFPFSSGQGEVCWMPDGGFVCFRYPGPVEISRYSSCNGVGTELIDALALNTSPNPFSSSVVISFEIDGPGRTAVEVMDLSGRMVRTLVDAELNAGIQTFTWDGTGEEGEPLSSGVYVCVVRSGGRSTTTEMCLLR